MFVMNDSVCLNYGFQSSFLEPSHSSYLTRRPPNPTVMGTRFIYEWRDNGLGRAATGYEVDSRYMARLTSEGSGNEDNEAILTFRKMESGNHASKSHCY